MDILTTSTPESDNDEIDPFTSLLFPNDVVPNLIMSPPNPTTTTTTDPLFRRHRLDSINADVITRQLPSEGLSFQLWPAATTLFSLLDNHLLNPSTSPLLSSIPTTTTRIRILELGSGTGLVGIAAASILGADVTVTDLALVIPNLQFNVQANVDLISSNGGSVDVAELNWGDVAHMESIGRDYHIILGSDVVYHDHLYEPLMETLRYFLLGGGGGERKEEMVFVMAHLKRWKKEAAFFKRARKFFQVDIIHRDSPSDGKRLGVIVYRFVPKHPTHGNGNGNGNGSTSYVKTLPLPIPNLENGF